MIEMMFGRTAAVLVLGFAVVTSLGACRPEEQGRILEYKKGVYLGNKSLPLSPKTRSMIRDRAWAQSGLGGASLPGAASGTSSGASKSVRLNRIGGQRAP